METWGPSERRGADREGGRRVQDEGSSLLPPLTALGPAGTQDAQAGGAVVTEAVVTEGISDGWMDGWLAQRWGDVCGRVDAWLGLWMVHGWICEHKAGSRCVNRLCRAHNRC